MEIQRRDRIHSQPRLPHWIRDKNLIEAHVKMGGILKGKALELGGEAGPVSEALKNAGWKWAEMHPGDISRLPYPDRSFDLITMRQPQILFEKSDALNEVRRVLKPSGRFVVSHLAPFSHVDAEYFNFVQIKRAGQSHSLDSLMDGLRNHAFDVVKKSYVSVRESVTLFMEQDLNLTSEIRQAVFDLVINAPDRYRKLRNVEVRNGEILENWNFVLLLCQPRPC